MQFAAVTLSLLMALFLGGCANQTFVAQCISEDWYERGFSDATEGLSTQQFLAYHNRCAQHGVTPHRTDYLSGWSAGRNATDPS